MAYVIIGGGGTYSVGKFHFKPGANPCDNEAVLERIRHKSPKWVTVQDDLEPPKVEETVEKPKRKRKRKAEGKKPKPDPYGKYRGRDGKWYYHSPGVGDSGFKQVGPFTDEKEADASIEAAKAAAPKPEPARDPTPEPVGEVPLASELAKAKDAATGTLTSEDLQSVFPCQHEGCESEFGTAGERANHERVAHPKRRIKPNA